MKKTKKIIIVSVLVTVLSIVYLFFANKQMEMKPSFMRLNLIKMDLRQIPEDQSLPDNPEELLLFSFKEDMTRDGVTWEEVRNYKYDILFLYPKGKTLKQIKDNHDILLSTNFHVHKNKVMILAGDFTFHIIKGPFNGIDDIARKYKEKIKGK